ncbi:hypothetical protein [Thermoleophilum album]|uniref:Uncharacterized protein n=1 Tax=Thermoleophilum album TaxID=29539 RepID=A0A1H6FZD8_THEAL|nr:hypothetical protein [Thermoleophilum album]SEH15065.1 hypothetical protein SAMN02745716_1831 [Thermoleophilum album]
MTIYCVIPRPLADQLYEKLSDYYRDDPNVEVIIDRRRGGKPGPKPADRGRRRKRVAGTFPPIDVPGGVS